MIRHKFNAVPTTSDGIRFSSRKEEQYYQNLKLLKLGGVVLFWLRQVPFHLTEGIKPVRYICDFEVFYADGHVEFTEVKGFETQTWKLKRRLMAEKFPMVKIQIV